MWQHLAPMPTPHQIRKALQKVANAAEFLRRHPDVPERTFWRQRSEHPTRMRESVRATLANALTEEGLLRAAKEQEADADAA